MKISHVLLASFALVSCDGQEAAAPTETSEQVVERQPSAGEIAEGLKAAGLPIENITIYTAETDPNSLLGRPNQYVGKADFVDTRQPGEEKTYTVEVFDSADAAKSRHDYVEAVTKDTPFLVQYQILNGRTLVRLDKALTPDQVEQYRAELAKLLP
jgi:hypothetical protein